MKKLRIGYLSTMYHTSHLIKGLKWTENFLPVDAEWRLFGTGPSMIEAFSADMLDMGYIGLPPVMIGIDRGLDLKCIAGGHVEGTVMIARSEFFSAHSRADIAPVLKQFKGKKIGSPAHGSIHDVILRFVIKQYGLEEIEVVNYPWADLIPEAMHEGVIDAAVGTPPLAALACRWYGYKLILPPSYLWPFNPSYGIVVTKKLLEEPEILRAFLGLHEKANNLIIHTPAEAAQAVANEVKVVDQAFVAEVFSISPRYCAAVPKEYIDSTLAFIPALKSMGYIKENLTQADIFELSFIEKVHPESHHYLAPPHGGIF
ncbi:MAG: ABC transporter substrate-binding protein [Pseudomonadota bacterium]